MEFPRLVAIETTNRCNASCSFCPNSALLRNRATMPQDLFEKIVRDCTAFTLPAIEPFLHGEPFVDPHIFDRLELIHSLLPSTKVRLYSNGAALTPARSALLRELRIDHLYLSINTLDPARYRRVTGLPFDRTLFNIQSLIEASPAGQVARHITLRLTVTHETTWKERAQFLLLCGRLGVRPLMVGLFNYKGDIVSDLPVPTYPCEHITRLDVMVDGNTALCCMDHEGEHGWGSLRDRSVLQVFNSAAAQRVRSLHRSGQRLLCAPCNRCNLFWADFQHVPMRQRVKFWNQRLAYHVQHLPVLIAPRARRTKEDS